MPLPIARAADSTEPPPDRNRISAFWAAHTDPDEVYEIRIPKPKPDGPRRFWGVLAGYFNDPDAVTQELGRIGGRDANGAYCSLNPVLPDLLARARNRLVQTEITTSDDEIPVLRRLLIDVDARHPRGVCATEAERSRAVGLRDTVRRFLCDELGWPEPEKLLKTGNGAALHYRLPDLPNTADCVALLRECLAALHALFVSDRSSASAVVDPTTFNPSRLTRVAGSVNALGDGTPNRPWRVVTAAYNPCPEAVPLSQLAPLAALAPSREPNATPHHGHAGGSVTRDWNLRGVLGNAGVGFREKPYAGGTIYRLDRCLTSGEHRDGAAIIELANGALAYKCHHASCHGKGWSHAKHVLPIPASSRRCAADAGRSPFRGFEFRDGQVVDR